MPAAIKIRQPEASPSKPSVKFAALELPTIVKKAKQKLKKAATTKGLFTNGT